MIGSFASGATASLMAKKGIKELSLPFEELKCSNLEFGQITPEPIPRTYLKPI